MNPDDICDPRDFAEFFKSKHMDYIDFGCSKGGSLLLGQERFGGTRGLGIDISPQKVEITRKAGFDAICYDINKIPSEKLAKFTILSHFLEHVPDARDCYEFVKKACEISTDFVFIQQPYFDADSYLLQNNLKLYWSDWTGHPNRMTSLDMLLLFKGLVNSGMDLTYSIHVRHPIHNSDSLDILPMSTITDQHKYDKRLHPLKKGVINFDFPVYRELIAIITMAGVGHRDILNMVKYDKTLVDMGGSACIIDNPLYLGSKLSNKQNIYKKSKVLKKAKKFIKKISGIA